MCMYTAHTWHAQHPNISTSQLPPIILLRRSGARQASQWVQSGQQVQLHKTATEHQCMYMLRLCIARLPPRLKQSSKGRTIRAAVHMDGSQMLCSSTTSGQLTQPWQNSKARAHGHSCRWMVEGPLMSTAQTPKTVYESQCGGGAVHAVQQQCLFVGHHMNS